VGSIEESHAEDGMRRERAVEISLTVFQRVDLPDAVLPPWVLLLLDIFYGQLRKSLGQSKSLVIVSLGNPHSFISTMSPRLSHILMESCPHFHETFLLWKGNLHPIYLLHRETQLAGTEFPFPM